MEPLNAKSVAGQAFGRDHCWTIIAWCMIVDLRLHLWALPTQKRSHGVLVWLFGDLLLMMIKPHLFFDVCMFAVSLPAELLKDGQFDQKQPMKMRLASLERVSHVPCFSEIYSCKCQWKTGNDQGSFMLYVVFLQPFPQELLFVST